MNSKQSSRIVMPGGRKKMSLNDYQAFLAQKQTAAKEGFKRMSAPWKVLDRFHIHLIFHKPADGSLIAENDFEDGSPYPNAEEFVCWPCEWDVALFDEASQAPLESPIHLLTISAVGWMPTAGRFAIQGRMGFANVANNVYWAGQIGIDGLLLGPA